MIRSNNALIFALNWKNIFLVTIFSLRGSLQVTKVVFIATIPKLNSHRRRGSIHSQASSVKSMLIIFVNVKGIVHSEQNFLVNSTYYVYDVLKLVRENIRKKRPEFWRKKSFLLHHYNASSHCSICTRTFLMKNSMTPSSIRLIWLLATWGCFLTRK